MLKHHASILTIVLGLCGTIASSAIIGRDERMTAPAYANYRQMSLAAVRARFGATLAITCEDMEGRTRLASGALVEQQDLVMTAAHLFMGPDGPHVASIDRCKVFAHDGKEWQAHEIDRFSIVSGARRVRVPDQQAQFDWVALRLVRPLTHITPYRLDHDAADGAMLVGAKVVNSAASHKNFLVNGEPPSIRSDGAVTPIFSHCAIRDGLARAEGAYLLKTDCDTGIWASGSPILIDEGPSPLMVGMVVSGGLESRNGTPYDARLNASTAIHVSGPVMAALRGLKLAAAQSQP